MYGCMRIIFCFLLLALPALAQATILRGRITDENGQGLPYASIYIKETASGTGSNEQGDYQLQLQPGTYTLEYRYIGYRAITKTVNIGQADQELHVQLMPETLNLKEVVVRAQEEDPAHTIMRQAIRLRKYHLNEVNAWSARVYMKQMQRLDDMPEKILGINLKEEGLKKGVLYLSESVSELHVQKPNKVRERVLSSRVSGESKGASKNRASWLKQNFYESRLKMGERGLVSPLASDAFLFYRFEYLGAFEENGHTINKIKVTPRRRHDPAFQGSIYIVEGSWRIYSLDLKVTEDSGIDYVDQLRIRQVYAPVAEHVWMPVSKKFDYTISIMGLKISALMTGNYSNYKVQPAYSKPPVLQEVEEETEPALANAAESSKPAPKPRFKLIKPDKIEPAAQQEIHDDQLFSKEVLVVEKDANIRDTAYWAQIRPIPLTQEEVQDYKEKDSLEVIQTSQAYLDSVDRKKNKLSVGDLAWGGEIYTNTYKRTSYSINPLMNAFGSQSMLQYNTVEGAVADVAVTYTKRFEDRRRYEITPVVRYGFANERLNATLKGSYTYNPVKNSQLSVAGGRYVAQINDTEPISSFVNSVYTLYMEENYLKLYGRDFARVDYRSELRNGVELTASLDYARRMPLHNTTDYALRQQDGEQSSFTSNVPVNAELADASFATHRALTAAFTLRLQPGQEYISRPNEKVNLRSKYPTFTLGFRTGLKALGGDTKYSTASVGISDMMHFGLLGSSQYKLTGGTFWNTNDMLLLDYKHFSGNRTILAGAYGGFQLLDYYRYSTNNRYLEGHYEHHFNGFWFNKVPLFRKLKWQEVVGVRYLNTRASSNYLEFSVGIEHIFKFFRVDVVTAFQNKEKVQTGVRVGFGF